MDAVELVDRLIALVVIGLPMILIGGHLTRYRPRSQPLEELVDDVSEESGPVVIGVSPREHIDRVLYGIESEGEKV